MGVDKEEKQLAYFFFHPQKISEPYKSRLGARCTASPAATESGSSREAPGTGSLCRAGHRKIAFNIAHSLGDQQQDRRGSAALAALPVHDGPDAVGRGAAGVFGPHGAAQV